MAGQDDHGAALAGAEARGGFTLTFADGRLALSGREFKLFSQLFAALDTGGDGSVSGPQGATFLRRSGLGEEVLRDVWRLASGERSKPALGRDDWMVACRLVAMAQAGELPLRRAALFSDQRHLPLPDFRLFGRPPDFVSSDAPSLSPNVCRVEVTSPARVGSGMGRHIEYTITTHANVDHLALPDRAVRRRYSDFAWLHQRLGRLFPGSVIPPLPGKRLFGNMSAGFVEDRRLALEAFLDHVARHPKLASCFEVCTMLEATTEGFAVVRAMFGEWDAEPSAVLDLDRVALSGEAPGQGGAGRDKLPSSESATSLSSGQHAPSPGWNGLENDQVTDMLAADDSLPRAVRANGSASSLSSRPPVSELDDQHSLVGEEWAGVGMSIPAEGQGSASNSWTLGGSWVKRIAKRVEDGLRAVTHEAPTGERDRVLRRELPRLNIDLTAIEELRKELNEHGDRIKAVVDATEKMIAVRRAQGYEMARLGAYFGAMAQLDAAPTPLHPSTVQNGAACRDQPEPSLTEISNRFESASNNLQDLNDHGSRELLGPLRFQLGLTHSMCTLLENHDNCLQALCTAHENVAVAKKRHASARAQHGDLAEADRLAQGAKREVAAAEVALTEIYQSVLNEAQRFRATRSHSLPKIVANFLRAESDAAASQAEILAPLAGPCR